MPTRDRAPIGSPCWADLWTSDVEGSRRFYGELFGWEASAPSWFELHTRDHAGAVAFYPVSYTHLTLPTNREV